MNTQAARIDLDDPDQSGVYLVTDDDLEQVAQADHADDICMRRVDLGDCADKAALFDTLAVALAFPSEFGRNWDALVDSLADLSWLPAQGYVLLLDEAQALHDAHPHDFDMLLDILDEVAASWAQARIPFFCFVAVHVDMSADTPTGEHQREDFHLRGEYVELNQLLKLTGVCDSGGAGKALVASGAVRVDGEVELRKTCKIRAGQRVSVDGLEIHVDADPPDNH
ncbi:hypothetical protein BTJ49_00075 [Oleiagrimonas sp. MCCC 1A03011]|nr:hypothetical protein BTJ49_00075 [Oleiagrimonas sp. MCCC 1A03011]